MHKYFSNRYNVLDVLFLLLQKIKNKEPFSLIRLGDGEGRMLGYPEFVLKKGECKEGLDYSLNIWFGHDDFSDSSLTDLSLQLRSAVVDADIIGMPRLKQYAGSLSYQHVFEAIERFQLKRSHQAYTDAAIHRYLQFGLFYREILQDIGFLGVITGRNELASKIQSTFNVETIDQYLVPAEAIHPGSMRSEHFPGRFNSLKEEIRVPYNGAVFLVGAGLLGKIYCQWIKEAGGVAIDIGSICDSWTHQGRLQHNYHKIEHYHELPHFSLMESANRFNEACDYFAMDGERLTSADIKKYRSENG